MVFVFRVTCYKHLRCMIAYKQVYKHSVQTAYKAGENKAIVKNSMQEKGTSSVIKKS